jgi:transcriptional regulator with XRE-family HTH domain
MNEEFGTLIRDARERAGISQRGLAIAIGVDPSYVSKIERGLLPPPIRPKVIAWLDMLDITDPKKRMRYLLASGYVSYEDVEKAAEAASITNEDGVKEFYAIVEDLRSATTEADKIDLETMKLLKESFGEDNLDELQELAKLFSRTGIDENTKKVVLNILVNAAKPIVEQFATPPKKRASNSKQSTGGS